MSKRILVLSDCVDLSLQLEKHILEPNELEITTITNVALDLLDDFDPHILFIALSKQEVTEEILQLIDVSQQNYSDRSFRTICALFSRQIDENPVDSLVDFKLSLPVTDREIAIVFSSMFKLLEREEQINELKKQVLVKQGLLTSLEQKDSISQIFNFPTICRLLEDSLRKAERFHEPLSIIILSIDEFVQLGYTYGPLFNMSTIQQVAIAITALLRDEDFVGRSWGGDFICVLPETDEEGALLVAERLKDCLSSENISLKSGDTLNLSVSQGISSYNPFKASNSSCEFLLTHAQEALSCIRLDHSGSIGVSKDQARSKSDTNS